MIYKIVWIKSKYSILVCLVLSTYLSTNHDRYPFFSFYHFWAIEIVLKSHEHYFWDSIPLHTTLQVGTKLYNNYFLYNTFPIVNTNPLLLFNVKLTLARWGPGNHFNGLIIGWPSGIVYIWANIPLGMYFQRVVVLLCVIYKQQKIGYHRYIIE